ncbi:type II toxin-antitoxin system HicB family antitoxin [Acrocarpospora sp. B8E8]|uniref:type II toxin-antitoxin system HicB family antitoxin n=1 Tax=Acrocarpospora sp. B8E8 TaxID=3153572 RepID=UPI00325E9466
MDERTGTYTIQVHDDADDGSLWAEVHELPGCFASGGSVEELWQNLADAIGLYLSSEKVRVQVQLHSPEPITVHTKEQLVAVC